MKRFALLGVMLMLPLLAGLGTGVLSPSHAFADTTTPNASQVCDQLSNPGGTHGMCVGAFRSSENLADICTLLVAPVPNGEGLTYPYYLTFGIFSPMSPPASTYQINSFGDCVSAFSTNKSLFLISGSGFIASQSPLVSG